MSPPRRKTALGKCPICGRPRHETFKPFCSKRCADIDLARWLDGRYAIAGKESDDAGEAEASPKQPDDEG
ncbi:MAG TPA: DNA gyrase inhibitor YacG [Rhizomicrobium sp.]|jgi:hypothetical protein|nr:DNA gyrase inhibitor YacG [Rhizomicrobium sp.]